MSKQQRHGEYNDEFPMEVWLGPDPELALVHVDMDAWLESHPCDCDALCECETRDEED